MKLKAVTLLIIIFGELAGAPAHADVKASKANAYTVIAPPPSVLTSKVNAYVVLQTSATASQQPSIFIMTQFKPAPAKQELNFAWTTTEINALQINLKSAP